MINLISDHNNINVFILYSAFHNPKVTLHFTKTTQHVKLWVCCGEKLIKQKGLEMCFKEGKRSTVTKRLYITLSQRGMLVDQRGREW